MEKQRESVAALKTWAPMLIDHINATRTEFMIKQYVEQRDGGYWVVGSRVSLDSVVCAFLSGQSAESIAQSFPVLSLEQVYGAIAFYLSNRTDIDAYLVQAKAEFAEMRQAARDADPMFYQKLADALRPGQTPNP
jgi:uncharacterized protein (DUF433 family)